LILQLQAGSSNSPTTDNTGGKAGEQEVPKKVQYLYQYININTI